MGRPSSRRNNSSRQLGAPITSGIRRTGMCWPLKRRRRIRRGTIKKWKKEMLLLTKTFCCFALRGSSSMHFGQLHSPLWWGMKKSVPFGSYVELLHFYTRTSFLEDPSGMILIPCELLLKECMCMTFNYHESSALIIWCFWILQVQTYFGKIFMLLALNCLMKWFMYHVKYQVWNCRSQLHISS